MIELVEVSKEHEEQAMAYRQEYINHGEKINGTNGFVRYGNYDDWLEKILDQKTYEHSSTSTSATTYFTIRKRDNKIIGSIQLRHHLTEELAKYGGHVGYGIRPLERGKGYGTAQLALILAKAKELNLSRIMISCYKDNHASAKVILKNGGKLAREGYNEEKGRAIEIYWIDLA